jgi:hypothetical protein
MRPVTIILLNYNGKDYLEDCLSSLAQTDYPEYSVILVDDGSSDGSASYVRERFPWVKVLENDQNRGAAFSYNRGLREAQTALVAKLDNDTVVDTKWLAKLVAGIESDPQAAVSTAVIRSYRRPEEEQVVSPWVHYIGQGLVRTESASTEEFEEVGMASGCAMLTDKDKLGELSFFDEDFFLYLDDVDFSLKILLAGFKIIYVRSAVVYHKSGGHLSLRKTAGEYKPLRAYLNSRNRKMLVLKNYSQSGLLLLAPGFILIETAWVIFLARRRLLKPYFESWRSIGRNWQKIMARRKDIQRHRRRRDGEVLVSAPLTPAAGVLASGLEMKVKKLMDFLLDFGFQMVRGFI